VSGIAAFAPIPGTEPSASSGSQFGIILRAEDPIADARQAGSELNRIDNGDESLFSTYDAL